MLAILLTLVAIRDPARKSLLHEIVEASGIIGKLAVEILDCVSKVLGNRLSAVHDYRCYQLVYVMSRDNYLSQKTPEITMLVHFSASCSAVPLRTRKEGGFSPAGGVGRL